MQEAFGIVLFAVAIIGVVVAVITALSSGEAYRQIGRGGLALDESPRPTAPAWTGSGAADDAQRDDEIRQMLEAGNARRKRRGEAPLDVDAELARLTAPGQAPVDAALREEVRQLVMARNARRVRRGEAPLDVEVEVDRQLDELT